MGVLTRLAGLNACAAIQSRAANLAGSDKRIWHRVGYPVP